MIFLPPCINIFILDAKEGMNEIKIINQELFLLLYFRNLFLDLTFYQFLILTLNLTNFLQFLCSYISDAMYDHTHFFSFSLEFPNSASISILDVSQQICH